MTTDTEALRAQFEQYVNSDGDVNLHWLAAGFYAGTGMQERWLDFKAGYQAGHAAAAVAKERKDWPTGILDRIAAAMKRIDDGDCPHRIPADPTDVDLVLAELRDYITGKKPPFWLDTIRAGDVDD